MLYLCQGHGLKLVLSFSLFIYIPIIISHTDVAIYGRANKIGSVARLPLLAEEMLKTKLSVSLNPKNSTAPVSFLLQPVWQPNVTVLFKPSKINIAFSVIESDSLPKEWVKILNNFDAIILPDPWLEEVYKQAGVRSPLFVLPHFMKLKNFLENPKNAQKTNIFTFGCSAAMHQRKNIDILIESFAELFGNNSNFQLKIHTRWPYNVTKINQLINKLDCKNISLIFKRFNEEEYIEFLKSLDCYVLLSSGEGFSLTPREAMALKIPCLITNNTGHTTIANSGLCASIECHIKKPAYYESFSRYIGYQFYPETQQVKEALLELTDNYSKYLLLAEQAYNWVQQYDLPQVAEPYAMLIKPTKIIFGDQNRITKDYLETNNKKLYMLYKKVYQL